MTEPNSGEEESADRLSELPDSLIFEIFWRLQMRDVVRTSLLSHRWKYLWTTSPYLNFKETKTDARDFIDSALMSSWRGTRIQKLKLDFVVDHLNRSDNSLYVDKIGSWFLFATKYRVQELHVHVRYQQQLLILERLHWVPQSLYTCSSLRLLVLKGFCLGTPINNVNWNQLKALEISDVSFFTEDSINQVLRGSPKLERLILCFVECLTNLCIQSSSLRALLISKYMNGIDDDPSTGTKLRISAPKLEILKLIGVPYSKCLMDDDAPFLDYVTLLFDGLFDFPNKTYYSDYLFYENGFCIENLRQILPKIQQVVELTLSDWCIEALVDMKSNNMISTFPYVEELKLHGCFEDLNEEIVDLLEIFPRLNRLLLENEIAYKEFHGNKQSWSRLEPNRSSSFLKDLSTITITWLHGVGFDEFSIFPLIELLLKYASKLEKMIFRARGTPPPSDSDFLALLKLLRSSPTADFIFDFVPQE